MTNMCPGCKITVFALQALISNYILPNLVGLQGVSKLLCATTCLERASCKSFFYVSSIQSCYLSDHYVQDSDGLVYSKGTRFYSKPLQDCVTTGYTFIPEIDTCVLDQSGAKMSWDYANNFCKNHHGMLMKAHTPERNSFFIEFAKTRGYPDLHLGARKYGFAWQWIDGTPVTNSHWRSSGQDMMLAAFINTYLQYCWCDEAYAWDDTKPFDYQGFLCEADTEL